MSLIIFRNAVRLPEVAPAELRLDLLVWLYRIARQDLPFQVRSFRRISGTQRSPLTLAVPWRPLYRRPDAPEMKAGSVIDYRASMGRVTFDYANGDRYFLFERKGTAIKLFFSVASNLLILTLFYLLFIILFWLQYLLLEQNFIIHYI